MDTVLDCAVTGIAMMLFIAWPLVLLYLVRNTSRNEGPLHGGGFEGSSAAFGYAPLDDPKDSSEDSPKNSADKPTA